jgi:hypothetical protein
MVHPFTLLSVKHIFHNCVFLSSNQMVYHYLSKDNHKSNSNILKLRKILDLSYRCTKVNLLL